MAIIWMSAWSIPSVVYYQELQESSKAGCNAVAVRNSH